VTRFKAAEMDARAEKKEKENENERKTENLKCLTEFSMNQIHKIEMIDMLP